jgi:ubiquinone/menaquinone biosynthesis C-methylase UbiE
MPVPFDRRINDNPSTYMVQDRKNKKELARLTIQDQMITAKMGGVLPEQPNPTIFDRVLDVACGIGSWAIEAAQTYPTMSLVGVDISQRMIDYACSQAELHRLGDRISFCVMDALHPLGFPDASFDLVNMRFALSFLRTWDWPKLLIELLRLTRPDGVVRVTDSVAHLTSSSPALNQLFDMFQAALNRAGHLFTPERTGLIDHLERLLNQYGCEQVQTKFYAMQYPAGTPDSNVYREDMTLFFQTTRPFIHKWNSASKDYDAIYQQAVKEMSQPDFHGTWDVLTAWGNKPKPARNYSLNK